MFKSFLISITAFLLFFSASPYPTAFASVIPIDIAMDDVIHHICTAVSIDAQQHLWLTAAHCMEDKIDPETGELHVYRRYIGGDMVDIVKVGISDLAVIHTARAFAPTVHVATITPSYGDPVSVPSYPQGWNQPILSKGYVLSPTQDLKIDETTNKHLLIDATAAHGSSGAPILNDAGEIISVLQTGDHDWGSLIGGCTYDQLIEFLGGK